MDQHPIAHTDQADTGPAPAGRVIYPDLTGKVAVVTGGSRGIGAATAAALAANGVAVAVVGRDRAAIGATVESITADGGQAIGLAADCTVEDDIDALRRQVADQLGPLDILAAFSGGDGMPVPTATETAAHWRSVVESDLTSTFLTVSAFLPSMIERHVGVMVTMASAAARQAAKSSAAYAAAKAGVVAFSRHLAGEYAPAGIRVNCLAPSAIENDKMRSRMSDEQHQALGEALPLGRASASPKTSQQRRCSSHRRARRGSPGSPWTSPAGKRCCDRLHHGGQATQPQQRDIAARASRQLLRRACHAPRRARLGRRRQPHCQVARNRHRQVAACGVRRFDHRGPGRALRSRGARYAPGRHRGGALVRAALTTRPMLIAATAVALASIVVAWLSGARFVGAPSNAVSLATAPRAALATLAYALVLFVPPAPASLAKVAP